MEFNKTKYDNNFIKENYDIIKITVKKGEKEKIIKHYQEIGHTSMGEYIRNLISKDMRGGVIERIRKIIQTILASGEPIRTAEEIIV